MKRSHLLIAGIGILAAQGLTSVALSRTEYLPSPPPLADMPVQVGDWVRVSELEVEPASLEMLAPDDFLNREYLNGDGAPLTLFIGYYKTQHRARNAHDPKVCLPGSGWDALESRVIEVPVPTGAKMIPVNYYIVKKQDAQNVVLYWYQSHNRAVAQEQILRLDKIFQTIRHNRTDMAFIRVVVPVMNGSNPAAARAAGVRFIQGLYSNILRQFTAV